MSEYDWNLSAGSPLCVFSDSFYYSVRDAIFRQLSKDSSKEQFQAALESLTRLREELEQDIQPMHYGALIGRHRCVEHLFKEARARLRSLEIMQPEPPQPEPAATQPPSLEEVVTEFERKTETYLGDREEEDDASGTTG
jgi:DNA-directed RNA polymerase specialized sigma24 family protein